MKDSTVERIRKFTSDRDWNKYHTPNALAKTIAIESTELLECFQWNENFKLEKVKEELADVIVNCQNLADELNLDLDEVVNQKWIKTRKSIRLRNLKVSRRSITNNIF